METVAPHLYLKTFGELQIFIGDKVLEHPVLSRKKVQTLLAILALGCGSNLSCTRIQEDLWSDSNPDKARNNFYSLWSLLKKALKELDLPFDYFIRKNGYCKMNTEICETDIALFYRLCSEIPLLEDDPQGITRLCGELVSLVQANFYPCDEELPFLVGFRREVNTKSVDALLRASRNLEKLDELLVALDLCRKALSIDEYREDIYQMIFHLQAEIGQRNGAMDTYFRYKKLFQEAYGIEPPQVMRLRYEDLLAL